MSEIQIGKLVLDDCPGNYVWNRNDRISYAKLLSVESRKGFGASLKMFQPSLVIFSVVILTEYDYYPRID
jgi:hypothetical protein